MVTLTIELPEALSREIERRGVSGEDLAQAVVDFLEAYLEELRAAAPAPMQEWSDGDAFARRLIDNNPQLFEELARYED